LTALRFDDGELLWRDRSVGKGSLTAADGRLYAFGQSGVLALVDATPDAYRERGRLRIEPQGPTYAPPVVSGGRLYLRDQDSLYVFDVRER
jgi:outer membrane protein assembly factor BamB